MSFSFRCLNFHFFIVPLPTLKETTCGNIQINFVTVTFLSLIAAIKLQSPYLQYNSKIYRLARLVDERPRGDFFHRLLVHDRNDCFSFGGFHLHLHDQRQVHTQPYAVESTRLYGSFSHSLHHAHCFYMPQVKAMSLYTDYLVLARRVKGCNFVPVFYSFIRNYQKNNG